MIDLAQIDNLVAALGILRAAVVTSNGREAADAATIAAQVAQIATLEAEIAALQPPVAKMVFGHGRNQTSATSFPQGCTSIRLWDSGVRWALLETSRKSYNWTKLDAYLADFEARGMDTLYCFGSTPAWTAQAGVNSTKGIYDSTSNRPPVLQDWSDFVTAIVAHVKRPDGTFRIRKWELWNETNNAPFWNGTNAQLLAMAKAAYGIIKAADPGAIVTTPTPCWTATTTYAALDTYFAMGFQKFADVVSFHGYLGDGTAATAIGPVIDSIRATMAKYGVVKPLWDTESGFKGRTLIADLDKPGWVTDWVNIRLQKKLDAVYWYQWDNQTNGRMFNTKTNIIDPWGTTWLNLFKANK